MTKQIKATSRSGTFKIRIEKGCLVEISSIGDGKLKKQIAQRKKDVTTIRYWMQIICRDDYQTFKEVLTTIKEDETFFSFGNELLKSERTKWEQRLKRHQEEMEEKISQLEEETKKLQRK